MLLCNGPLSLIPDLDISPKFVPIPISILDRCISSFYFYSSKVQLIHNVHIKNTINMPHKKRRSCPNLLKLMAALPDGQAFQDLQTLLSRALAKSLLLRLLRSESDLLQWGCRRPGCPAALNIASDGAPADRSDLSTDNQGWAEVEPALPALRSLLFEVGLLEVGVKLLKNSRLSAQSDSWPGSGEKEGKSASSSQVFLLELKRREEILSSQKTLTLIPPARRYHREKIRRLEWIRSFDLMSD